MNTPEWLKPGAYVAVIGAAVKAIGGFSWGGWGTGGRANDLAMEMAHNDVVSAMVPVCLDMSENDPFRMTNLEMIRDTTSYKRRDAVMETGWATMPGAEAADRDIAQASLEGLDVDNVPASKRTDAETAETVDNPEDKG